MRKWADRVPNKSQILFLTGFAKVARDQKPFPRLVFSKIKSATVAFFSLLLLNFISLSRFLLVFSWLPVWCGCRVRRTPKCCILVWFPSNGSLILRRSSSFAVFVTRSLPSRLIDLVQSRVLDVIVTFEFCPIRGNVRVPQKWEMRGMWLLSTFVHFLRALLLATQTQKSRWRQEHGFEPSPSDGEGREHVTKTANDLDRLRIRLVKWLQFSIGTFSQINTDKTVTLIVPVGREIEVTLWV